MKYNIKVLTYELEELLFQTNNEALLENNILTFNTDTDTIKINLEDFHFLKENYESVLKITPTTCTLTLKELNKSLNIPLDYINYNYDHNKNINIEYKLISQEKPLKILITIGDEIHEL